MLFSLFIDVGMYCMRWFQPETLGLRLVRLILVCVILAVGISVEVAPSVVFVPGEGLVQAIADILHRDFGAVKVYFDITLIMIAGTMSLCFFHAFRGIGVGTIVSVVTVGRLVSLVNRYFPLIAYIKRLVDKG